MDEDAPYGYIVYDNQAVRMWVSVLTRNWDLKCNWAWGTPSLRNSSFRFQIRSEESRAACFRVHGDNSEEQCNVPAGLGHVVAVAAGHKLLERSRALVTTLTESAMCLQGLAMLW